MTTAAVARPLTLMHQLRVVDATGAAVNGTMPVVVTLWRDATSTLPADRLWLDTRTESLTDGYASLTLALADDGATLDSAWFASPIWLELTVNGTPMSPRQRVADVPGTGSSVTTGTRPATAGQGDLYFNNGTDTLEVYDAGAWTAVRAFDPIATSCKWLHTGGVLQSGTYNIDADGNGPLAAQGLYCDMTTDGGGWTEVFVATTSNYNTASIG